MMETIIKGMQVTNIEIKESCRETHGDYGALQRAFEIIKDKYLGCVDAEVNKDVAFNLTLTLDR